MTRKLFFVLTLSSLILFFSCGSTKQADNQVSQLEPAVETEESQTLLEETNTDQQETETEENAQTEENASEENESEQTEGSSADDSLDTEKEDINALYPPLEEIEDPQLIEISPEEIEEQLVAAAKETEENQNKITEPVEETEELPPLPATEETSVVTEPVEGAESLEGQEEAEENLEPVIEIQTEEEAEEEEEILPSRSVTLKKGETLVITYPGNGWIYMGSTSEYNNLASRGRKLGTTDTKYTLLAKEAGTQIHHFYKVDNLTGQYIDDYIEVIVLEKKGSSSTVVNAPDYSDVVPKKPETPAKATPKASTKTSTESVQETSPAKKEEPAQVEKKPEEKVETKAEKQTSSTTDESEDSVIVIGEEEAEETFDIEPLIKKTRSLMTAKDYDSAYPLLIQYLEFSTDNRDEALYLLGQILESNSKYRDIKQAVETYQTLCDSYPASQYWENANKRIVYLKRFYINIH